MALLMEESQFLAFYKDTLLGYSKTYQKYFVRQLKAEGYITDDEQCSLSDKPNVFAMEKHQDEKSVITFMTQKSNYAANFEYLEFLKLYKYSVPLFYTTSDGISVLESLQNAALSRFEYDTFTPSFVLSRTIGEDIPQYYVKGDDFFIKFVLQKAYPNPEDYQPINYRYPVVIYINPSLGVLEIRFDSVRYDPQFGKESYENLLNDCVAWIKDKLKFSLFLCEHSNAIAILNSKDDESVKIYKQMMELGSGGSAELTASAEKDYVLPFIGELRELISENEEIFSRCSDVKELLLNYLNEKEATASYPYVYIKRVAPVESDSYILKVTFEYYFGKYTGLQHQTGTCRDLGMERMNDAIKYLCESGSFTKGDST